MRIAKETNEKTSDDSKKNFLNFLAGKIIFYEDVHCTGTLGNISLQLAHFLCIFYEEKKQKKETNITLFMYEATFNPRRLY